MMATIIEQNSSLILFKDEDKSNKKYDCPFCLLHFDAPSLRKQHVLGHFLKKTCNNCDFELIKICDDWYALHPCDQNEPEIDCEPPAINFIEVKIEDPGDVDSPAHPHLLNIPTVNVNEDIVMVNIYDLHCSNTTADMTFETYLDQPAAKETHEQSKQSSTRLSHHPHRVQKKLECDICGVVISSFHSMVLHMESKHVPKEKRQRFKTCEICDKKLYTARGVRHHMDNHRSRLEFVEVEPSTSSHVKAIEPLKTYTIFGKVGMSYDPNQTRNKFRCETCTFSTSSITELEKHVDTKHRQLDAYKRSTLDDGLIPGHPHRVMSNLECDICKSMLSSFYNMALHMEAKHTPKEKRKQFYKCTICQKKVFTPRGMSLHLENHRIKAGEIEKTSTSFVCSFCGKKFANENYLKCHENLHIGKNRCEQCGKDLSSRAALRKHIQSVHLGERHHACQFENCKSKFADAAALRVHRARKHGIIVRPNPCPICGKDFPGGKSHLNRHLKAHENNRAKEYIKPAP